MRVVALALLGLAGVFLPATRAVAGGPAARKLSEDRDVYLMEDDLVYARFLLLARDGSYRQINRDERAGTEVDRGHWEQDAAGTLRLHSTCHALRPRAVSGGRLSVALPGESALEVLPSLLAAVRHFLAVNADDVFAAGATAELNTPGAPAVHVDGGAQTFERRDLAALAANLEAALASERTGTYLLEPVKDAAPAYFLLRGGTVQAADLRDVRRNYRVAGGRRVPFFFARVEGRTFATAVGRWEPLRLPGGVR